MAFNDNQNEYPIPVGNDRNGSDSLLPRYFRTDANRKFLGSTLDQVTNPGVVEKVNGFVGSREAKAAEINDNYIDEVSKLRQDYQFEPYSVIKDSLNNVVFNADYLDILGQISAFGGSTANHDSLFKQEFYAWEPHINFDKFTNFREYYWLPNGPQEIPVKGQSLEVTSTFTVETVIDDDNTAFVFTPDGLTRNKNIKLFRGQTYRFEVDTPNHPIGFALYRGYKPAFTEDSSLVTTVYTDGVTITHNVNDTDTLNAIEDYIKPGFVENGVIEFTVPMNAPDTLYYISQFDVDTSGAFQIYDIEENTFIDVEEEILGKKTYKTSDGWEFSNGMKVYFQGNVTPAKYEEGLYYVEGVGNQISLIPVNDLEVPAIFTEDTQIPFDVNGFDRVPFSDARSFAGAKDYIVVDRRDKSRNAWARYNRWFHRSVIEKSAEINNQPAFIDQNFRAKRPIIEFENDLKLYNHGIQSKENVDLVDDWTKDIGSLIEGNTGYNVDGVDLVDGMRVLFTADEDSLFKNKIFVVNFIRHNNRNQISLLESSDSDPAFEETVLIKDGTKYAGKMFWYDGETWNLAQDKTGLNQAPRFDLVDVNGVSLSDETVYPNTDFIGNRIFSYRVGESVNDDELGFPIVYKNFSNIGDIVFDFNLLEKTYQYELNQNVFTINSDIAFLRKHTVNGTKLVNGWTKANRLSRQFVVRKFTGQELTNSFPIDMFDNSAELLDLDVRVFVNNDYKLQGKDYTLVGIDKTKYVQLNTSIGFDDIVIIKAHSAASKNDNGYYEIPHNFERNPLNENVTEFTLGQVNDHVEGLVQEINAFTGIHPGVNNLRDLGPIAKFGRKIVQHSGPVNIPMYHLVSQQANVLKALKFANNEYGKFKRNFMKSITDDFFDGTVKDHVDFCLQQVNNGKNETMPFYSTDMAGIGGANKIVYDVLDARNPFYALSEVFDKTTISKKAVYVYINGTQLVHGTEYDFTENGFVEILTDFNDGDKIEIFEYTNTEGSYIPTTPTKIGMYPAYRPEKFLDSSYAEPVNVIRGHDGSLIVAFDDYRDDLILEFEKRIYNNIKVAYDTSIFDIDNIKGGQFRNTNVSSEDLDRVMIADFLDWAKIARQVNYTNNDFVSNGSTFTYNYKKSQSPDGKPLKGFWRAVYKDAYDTDRPHTHPWEMLGFASQPTWWQSVYGPAPYTSNNLVLWQDLEQGKIKEPDRPVVINKKYIRPGLSKHIPVNENGQLLSPLESSYAQNFSYVLQRNELFAFGDEGPTETAWRRSSSYPFSFLIACIVNKPALTLGIGFDRSRTIRDLSGDLVYRDTNKRINLENFVFPKVVNETQTTITSGLVNLISEYVTKNKTSNYESYVNNLRLLKNQLGIKVAGFADKEKFRLVLDSKTPLNKGNVFVPYENYQLVFRSSAPQEVVTYSGVIIEKTGGTQGLSQKIGYKISGYDKAQPYFEYTPIVETSSDPNFNVGGISESFIEWTENKTYIAGKIVQNNGKYYRVNVNHNSGDTFNIENYTLLPELPVVGGVNAKLRKNFSTKKLILNYGTVLDTEQQVVDFLLGYQKRLQDLGFEFNYFNPNTGSVENWSLSAKEFLFWTTQNWATSSVITLSPGANKLVFERDYFVVSNMYDNFYGYSILNQSQELMSQQFTNVVRDSSNQFGLTALEDGIYLAKLPLVQKEHVVLLDNNTVFNDTIYDPVPGYRQQRIKVVGYRTDNWNGGLNIPGFTYDDAKVTAWESWKDYEIGDLVKFKEFYYSAKTRHSGKQEFDYTDWNVLPERPTSGITPNWDYRANQFADFYDLDTDNFDSEQQRLAQHLIGYQQRDYLANIIQDDVSQYKFYQGMIQEKGTKNALNKMFDKLGSADKDSLEFYEEWAFRVGQYGATTSFDEVEYVLDESKFRLEPQAVELVSREDTTRTDLVYQYPLKDVYVAPDDYNHAPFPIKFTNEEYSKTGGYIKLDQINFIAKRFVDIVALDVNAVDIGNYIWVPEAKQTWNVYKHILSPLRVLQINVTDAGFEAVFNKPIPFEDGEIIGFNNINDEINGFYIARNISYDTMEVYLDVALSMDSVDLSDSTVGIVTQLNSRRVDSTDAVNTITKLYDLDSTDRFWIDDNGNGKFQVIDVESVFDFKTDYNNPELGYNDFAKSIAVSGNNTVMAIGVPGLNKVYIYSRGSELNDLKILQTLQPNENLYDNGAFGTSVSITENGQYLFVGAPTASNVLNNYKGELDPVASYSPGDIVSQRGTLWKALNSISPDSSTINTQSQDWEEVFAIEATVDGTSSALANQGVIHIYQKQVDNSFREKQVITSPAPLADEQFGIALKSSSSDDFHHRIYVRSLVDNGRIYFIENIDGDTNSYTYTRDRSYKGEFSSIYKYIEGEKVIYVDRMYQAKQTVFAGNNFNETAEGEPADHWEPVDSAFDYLGYVPNSGVTDLLDDDSSEFSTATLIGETFDVSKNGEVLVIVGKVASGEQDFRASVYRRSNGRYYFESVIDTPIDNTLFGSSVAINSAGNKIAIGAFKDDISGIDMGKVYVYKQVNGVFTLDQELYSPDGEKNEQFGYKLDFSSDKLAVLSINGDTSYKITFDDDETAFDNRATEIVDTIKNNGQVYIFEDTNNILVYAEKMQYSTDITSAKNPYIVINRNHYYLVAPDTILPNTNARGLIAEFRSDINAYAIKTNSIGEDFVDTSKIRGVFLYDKTTSDLVTYLDYIDPIQGKIPGPAEQEIYYKLYYDPAAYNIGTTTTGATNYWDNSQVGRLWWDLSSVKWYNPYQGNIEYKMNTWNKIIPGFSLDVYEWVESDYLPEEWDSIADTVEGLADGISGVSKYGNNSYTRANVYDPITGTFVSKYYFWVKGKKTLPNNTERKLSAYAAEQLILDPAANGYRFITLASATEFALHNIRSLIRDKDIVLHIDYNTIEDADTFNIHSEYELLTEGLASSKPSSDIVEKWIDSLAGYNKQGSQLPSTDVSIARRYGILNTPLQTMFVNKTEAVKQIVERVNEVFVNNLIVDDFDISPLFKIDNEPSAFSGEWDVKVESENLLRFVGTAKLSQAKLTPVIEDGVIIDVIIVQSGRGYVDPSYVDGTSTVRKGPAVEIVGSGKGAEIQTYINNLGQITNVVVVNGGKNYQDTTTLVVRPFSVLVQNDSTISGFWAMYSWNSTDRQWFRQYIQNYDTTKYWQYKDWYAEGYSADTAIDFEVPGSYALTGLIANVGSVVKIATIGSGGWLLVEKIDNQDEVDYTVNYKTVGRQNGTLQLSKLLYNNKISGFDNSVYDSNLYDREPVDETRIIMEALRDNIFVDQLEVEWNKLFFASVRYAMSEQTNVDWVFKSSFVTAKHNVGELEQKITYQNDNLENYQDYVNEVKPYKTKVREYISAYQKVDPTQTSVTDFDLPTRYDVTKRKIVSEELKVINSEIRNINNFILTYPQKHWFDNVGYEITDFKISNPGSGYAGVLNITVSGGGGPTLKGYGYLAGDKLNFVEVDTAGAKYISAPSVTVEGTSSETGEVAKVSVIIGNGVVRNTHLLMKFDRTSGNYLFETLNETQTFTGNGGTTTYELKWPMSTKTIDTTVYVNNELQLSSDYTVLNKLDTSLGYDRYLGIVEFTNPPAVDSDVVINYKKSTSLLNVADRIKYFYEPTTGMLGKDLGQLMDGIDYGGVELNSIGFGTDRGFEATGYGENFDTFEISNQDEIIVLDGSTQVVSLSDVLQAGKTYNVYLNNVRIDDPNYNNELSPNVQTGLTNPNAKLQTLIGDDITNTVFLNSDVIETKDGDIVIVRESTSDGSFEATTALDVDLRGGSLDGTTATGIDAGDIVVDGDDFVSETVGKGPEEQVPGQVMDTLDIQVYNRVADGSGIINARHYTTDGVTLEYEFDAWPQSKNSILVKLDNWVLNNDDIEVDWVNKTIRRSDSTAFESGKNLSIITIGSNGTNIIDNNVIIADGDKKLFELGVKFTTNIDSFVTLNGVLQTTTDPALYAILQDANGNAILELGAAPTEGSVINYTLYDGGLENISQLLEDETFVADGVNKIHRFDETIGNIATPYTSVPLAHNILVAVQERFLNPGYRKVYTLTTDRAYDIDAWQFEDTTQIRSTDVFVYVDGVRLGQEDYDYDPINGRIELLKYNVGLAGQEMEIFVLRDAEYYFVNTVVTISNGTEINDRQQGDIIEFRAYDDSTVVSATVEAFERNTTTGEIVLTLQGYVREIAQLQSLDDTPYFVLDLQDSTQAILSKIECVESEDLVLAEPPADGAYVKIYAFNNHDINEFDRRTYDVIYNTSQAPRGTQEYVDKNLLQRGYIKLSKPAYSTNHVWVFRNGVMQSPNVQYKITDSLDAIQILGDKLLANETIDVFQFAAPVSTPKYGYRIFKDILNRTHYKRLNSERVYELAQDLNWYDTSIVLTDGTGLTNPNRNLGLPGVVWINKERIEYYTVDGNILRQIRRSTLGTGCPPQHTIGSKVVGQGLEENIPYKDEVLKTTYTADGSTGEIVLDFIANINDNGTVDNAEIFVAGRRLRKTPLQVFDHTLDQDSPAADVTVPPEYQIENVSDLEGNISSVLILADIPLDNQRIEVVRKIGRTWNDPDKSLADSNTKESKFITDKTISLPR